MGKPEPSLNDFREAYLNRTPFMAISPPVLPPADDYPPNVHVTGFLFLDEGSDWKPPASLVDFLDAREAPIYIGFGSMTGHTAENTILLLIEALDGRRNAPDGRPPGGV